MLTVKTTGISENISVEAGTPSDLQSKFGMRLFVINPVHVGLVEIGGVVILEQVFGNVVFDCVVHEQSLEFNVVF